MRNPNTSKSLNALLVMAGFGSAILAGDQAPEYPAQQIIVGSSERRENLFRPYCNFIMFASVDPKDLGNIIMQIDTVNDSVPGFHNFFTATFNFGDGSTRTTPTHSVQHHYQEPGRYMVTASFAVIPEKGVAHPSDYQPTVCPPQAYTVHSPIR